MKQLAIVLCLVVWALSATAYAVSLQQIFGTGVTTNQTSSPFLLQGAGKSVYAEVVGSGAVTATIAIYGDNDVDAANGILLCTITLSGTNRSQDACPVITANFTSFYAVLTNLAGTGATVKAYAMY